MFKVDVLHGGLLIRYWFWSEHQLVGSNQRWVSNPGNYMIFPLPCSGHPLFGSKKEIDLGRTNRSPVLGVLEARQNSINFDTNRICFLEDPQTEELALQLLPNVINWPDLLYLPINSQ